MRDGKKMLRQIFW